MANTFNAHISSRTAQLKATQSDSESFFIECVCDLVRWKIHTYIITQLKFPFNW